MNSVLNEASSTLELQAIRVRQFYWQDLLFNRVTLLFAAMMIDVFVRHGV